jgi:hypothetical protein
LRYAYRNFRNRCLTADEDYNHICGLTIFGQWPDTCKRYGRLRSAWLAVNSRFLIWEGR